MQRRHTEDNCLCSGGGVRLQLASVSSALSVGLFPLFHGDGKQSLTHVDSKERVLHILVFNHPACEQRAGKLEDAGRSQLRSAPPPRRSRTNLPCESAASLRGARRFLQRRFKGTPREEAAYSNLPAPP